MASYAFRIRGIEPAHDPAWRTAPDSLRRAFWQAVVRLGIEAKERELAEGKGVDGQPLKAISPYTRAHRKSAMGKADPNAPPLTPARGLSRTRSLLDGRANRDHAEFFWRFDPVTGQHWGKILGYHRAGAGHLPKRDVIGISAKSIAWVKARAWEAWEQLKRGIEAEVAQSRLSVRITPPAAAPKPPPPPKPAVPKPAQAGVYYTASFPENLDKVTFGIGGDRALAEKILASGRSSGLRQKRIAPPPPKPPGVPRPQPVTPPPVHRAPRLAASPKPVFIASAAAELHGDVTVHVDVRKLDLAARSDGSFYVGSGGVGGQTTKYQGVEQFLKEKKPLEQPRLALGLGGGISFRDGRHRFAVLRDKGVLTIPVSVPKSDAAKFRRLFGAQP